MGYKQYSYVDARDEVTAVPNGVRLPPISMTTKASSSAAAEATKQQKAYEKDKYGAVWSCPRLC